MPVQAWNESLSERALAHPVQIGGLVEFLRQRLKRGGVSAFALEESAVQEFLQARA